MKWFLPFTLMCAGLFTACGPSDSDESPATGKGGEAGMPSDPMAAAGNDAAAGEAPVGPQCDMDGDGACQNADDCPIIISGAGTSAGQSCGLSCLGDDDLAGCVESCFVDTAQTSQACSACYGALLDCVIGNCFEQCASDSKSDDCVTCRTDAGCDPNFRTCSGLPPTET